MYFPYLRGKQFELIALRELAEKGLISNKILPIIEPIKPTSTFFNLIQLYKELNKDIAIISNPQVGNFSEEIKNNSIDMEKKVFEYYLENNIICAHLMGNNTDIELQNLLNQGIEKKKMLIINSIEYMEKNKNFFNEEPPRYNLIPDSSNFRRSIKDNKVMFSDRFNKQSRNHDYCNNTDEFFSNDHLYYDQEGFLGFSDYSIVGSGYSEAGFSPYAVAIHIVYFDSDKNLRIAHFVSDSNKDINNPANKFYEALTKLNSWKEINNLDTYAIQQFLKYYKEESYPGLGTVKKLSIMHHIELISKYLNGELL